MAELNNRIAILGGYVMELYQIDKSDIEKAIEVLVDSTSPIGKIPSIDAINLAVIALKRQIPMPIKKKTFEEFGTVLGCPYCDYSYTAWSIGRKDEHCPKCGQALKWED